MTSLTPGELSNPFGGSGEGGEGNIRTGCVGFRTKANVCDHHPWTEQTGLVFWGSVNKVLLDGASKHVKMKGKTSI